MERAALTLPASVEMKTAKRPTEADKIFRSMREKIAEVFPDDDETAWSWTDENYQTHELARPDNEFDQWLEDSYEGSDEFSQLLVRRMFAIWREMEEMGFEANDHELYEHQMALFAWIALSTTTGTREEIANLLVRSPYGSGKSLVAGLTGLALRHAQEELLQRGVDHKEVPTGILLGLRKEHMLQNALGKQYSVLQPPYVVERADIAVYWKNLASLYGDDFSKHFEKPKGVSHGFYDLFNTSEDDESELSASQRVERYISSMSPACAEGWKKVKPAKKQQIIRTLTQLVAGEIIFVPDIYNVPQVEKPVQREIENDEAVRYRGDSAFAFSESEGYRVKATHKHLALDRSSYTTQANVENPGKMLIAYGSMVTRAPENIRIDIREEIMGVCRELLVDEAGSFTPGSLGDSISQISGQDPYIVGFTGGDRGIEGWTRSPRLSDEKMIQLGLMKPIAFQGIGNAENPPAQGSEEAWAEYQKMMFADVKTASTLGLPQPHELDTVVVAPPENVREYAHRIKKAHDQQKIPVKIWCFDPIARDSRWSIIVNGFNAPKEDGDPKRILVAPPTQMSEALHLHAECYDILANMSKYPVDQTRGRLGHIRNTETGKAREKARTYFRMQWLEGARGEAYIREVAKMMGIEMKDEDETWQALRCMIDLDAYEKDGKRRNLSAPQPIPDTLAVQKRKKRRAIRPTWTPLKATSPYVIEQERKAAARRAEADQAAKAASAGRTTAPRPEVPAVKLEEFTAVDKKAKVSITIKVNGSGHPVNIAEIAATVAPYSGSYLAKINSALREGVRGADLASVALAEYVRIKEVITRRSGWGRERESSYVDLTVSDHN